MTPTPADPAGDGVEVWLDNPRADRVKRVHRLARRVGRERGGRFLAEGPQAVREAVAAHGRTHDVVEDLYVTSAALERWPDVVAAAREAGLTPLGTSDPVMAALTDTVSPQGLLAVCRTVDHRLDAVLDAVLEASRTRGPLPLLAVLVHGRDPGNAGTVLRAADAAGACGVVLTEASVDVHNPKVVRSTAGSLFHLPVCQGPTLADVVAGLRARGVVVLAADGAGDHDLDDLLDEAEHDSEALLRRPTAWLFGNEAWGLADDTRALADAVVRVPLRGSAESLNLAMAATVCLYASSRALTTARRATDRASGRRTGGETD
ncbi:MAG: TrmH family RNA methyltransferase [Angustibacter sp.]